MFPCLLVETAGPQIPPRLQQPNTSWLCEFQALQCWQHKSTTSHLLMTVNILSQLAVTPVSFLHVSCLYLILVSVLSVPMLFPLSRYFHARTPTRAEPAQRIVKAELVDYPQDEGPVGQENKPQSKICSVQ